MANGSTGPRSCWPRWDENRLFTLLLALLLVYASVWLLTASRNNVRQFDSIGRAAEAKRTIRIAGTAKTSATPTVARLSVGVLTEGGVDIATAQKQNSDKMNALLAAMKSLGVAAADLQTTNYTIYPRYDYQNGKSLLVGYTVSQNASVKVRDLGKVSAVFQRAGELGANQVSGPDFTIDDPESLQAEVRGQAITNARAKAAAIARALGVKLGRVVSFDETGGPMPSPVALDAMKEGIGGGAPQVESGSLEVSVTVNVEYEID